MNSILLTGTVFPHKDIVKNNNYRKNIDHNVRLKEYIDTILYYIIYSNFDNIVFCDNSNYNFDYSFLYKIADLYGKDIELLKFVGDHKIAIEKGYGYGDSEIIDYAFKNSKILKRSKSWYKVTGRYKVKNINDIIRRHKDNDNLFETSGLNRELAFFGISTGFFKVSNDFYGKYLFGVGYKLYRGFSLESLYYLLLRGKLTNQDSFRIQPYFLGQSLKGKMFSFIRRLFGLYGFGFFYRIFDRLVYPYYYKNFLKKK